jgi:hypothetical protein
MGWMTQASTSAQRADSVFLFVFALSVFFLVGITAVMIYFVIRYSKKRHPKAEQIENNFADRLDRRPPRSLPDDLLLRVDELQLHEQRPPRRHGGQGAWPSVELGLPVSQR